MNKEKYIIDFREVKYYLEMHGVIWKALKFPDYYGCNWSAFWDCLTDMYGDPIHIEILGLDVIDMTVKANDRYYVTEGSFEYIQLTSTMTDENQIYRFSDYGIQASKDGISFTLKANMGT